MHAKDWVIGIYRDDSQIWGVGDYAAYTPNLGASTAIPKEPKDIANESKNEVF